MNALKLYDIPVAGKERWWSAGHGRRTPPAMLLLQDNATVTVCHTKTVELQDICRRAEILVTCRQQNDGDESYVQEGAVVIDVGINVDENGHLCGDVDFDAISSVAAVCDSRTGGLATNRLPFWRGAL